MRCGRPGVAADPFQFGRRREHPNQPEQARALFSANDARLFLTTFAAGFAFVAMFIA